MAVYEYNTVRNIEGRKCGGAALLRAMFRRPEPGETSQEMKLVKLALQASKWPVHKIAIEEAELREKETLEKKTLHMLAVAVTAALPPTIFTTKRKLVKEAG